MNSSLQAIAGIFLLSILIEACVEIFLPTFPDRWKYLKVYIAAAFAIGVCIGYSADLPAALGLQRVPYLGETITGLILGRGANFLSVLYKRLQVVSAPSQSVASVPTPEDLP